jgi:hypothetical protein
MHGYGNDQPREKYTDDTEKNTNHTPCHRVRYDITVANGQPGNKCEVDAITDGYLFSSGNADPTREDQPELQQIDAAKMPAPSKKRTNYVT